MLDPIGTTLLVVVLVVVSFLAVYPTLRDMWASARGVFFKRKLKVKGELSWPAFKSLIDSKRMTFGYINNHWEPEPDYIVWYVDGKRIGKWSWISMVQAAPGTDLYMLNRAYSYYSGDNLWVDGDITDPDTLELAGSSKKMADLRKQIDGAEDMEAEMNEARGTNWREAFRKQGFPIPTPEQQAEIQEANLRDIESEAIAPDAGKGGA